MTHSSNLALLKYIAVLLGLFCLLGLVPQFSLEIMRTRQDIHDSQYLDASSHLAKAAIRLPWRNDLWESAGHYAFLAGDYRAAIQYLEKANLAAAGYLDLGDAYQQMGQTRLALKAWQDALATMKPTSEIMDRVYQANLTLNDYPSATLALQTLVNLQPKDINLRLRLALLLSTGQPSLALEQFQVVARLQPVFEPILAKIEPYLQTNQETSDPAYTSLEIGRILASSEQWELAFEIIRQATSFNPQYAEAWAYLGEARQHLDQVTQTGGDGLEELQTAVGLDPNSLSANTFLAIYWLRHERFDMAEKYLRNAIKVDPQNPNLYVDLGNTLAASGDLDKAYSAFQDAIDLAPYNALYLRYLVEYSLAYSYKVSEIALPVARQMVILAPYDPLNLDCMAQLMIHLEDLASARRYLGQALDIDPECIPAHLHLGTVLFFQEDLKAAFQELNWVRSHAPDSPYAKQATRLLETYFPGVKLP